ncbi:hypothetical protein D3C86_1950530 [compost metagenome]
MAQDLQAVMLQITEINKSPASLLRAVAFPEGYDRLRQLLHQRSRLMQLSEIRGGRTAE